MADSNLNEFADQFMVAIAMTADEQSLGVDGDQDEFARWSDRLHQAVDDGLEDAAQRAGIFNYPEGD